MPKVKRVKMSGVVLRSVPELRLQNSLGYLIYSRVRFPSLGLGTHLFTLYILHPLFVPSSHTIPIIPNLVPPCFYLPDCSCPQLRIQLSYINPPVLYLVPHLKST
jgi:hypothetical protein